MGDGGVGGCTCVRVAVWRVVICARSSANWVTEERMEAGFRASCSIMSSKTEQAWMATDSSPERIPDLAPSKMAGTNSTSSNWSGAVGEGER